MELISFWIITLPLSYFLGFIDRPTYGLDGIWYGLLVGIGLLALSSFIQIFSIELSEQRKFMYHQSIVIELFDSNDDEIEQEDYEDDPLL